MKQTILNDIASLKHCICRNQLFEYANQKKWSGQNFNRFKKYLKEIGIDYEIMPKNKSEQAAMREKRIDIILNNDL